MTPRWKQTHERAVALAESSYGVVNRARLRQIGVTREDVRTHVRAGRWMQLGNNTFRPPTNAWCPERSPIAVAVFETQGPAWAEASSALILHGLRGWSAQQIVVALPHYGQRTSFPPGTRGMFLFRPPRLSQTPIPHSHPAWASLRAAAIARTDREAATVLAMTVQQRLARADDYWQALECLPKLHRRKLIRELLGDITTGSESIGEIDFVQLCRRRGLPVPDRQVRRRHPNGSYYLDVRWEAAKLTVEIDGMNHFMGDNPTQDALRQNYLTLGGDAVLRIPVVALRTDPDPFFAQIEHRLRLAGLL